MRELIDQFTGTDDQGADSCTDQRAAQEDQRRGKAAHRKGGNGQPGHPAARHECGEGRGIGGKPCEIVEYSRYRTADGTGAARHVGKRIRHRFQCRCDGGGQPVGQAQPDQAQLGDGIAGAFDLGGISRADRHPEILHVLCRLSQGCGVDAQKGQCGAITEKIRCHGGAFCFRNELVQCLLNGDDALVER